MNLVKPCSSTRVSVTSKLQISVDGAVYGAVYRKFQAGVSNQAAVAVAEIRLVCESGTVVGVASQAAVVITGNGLRCESRTVAGVIIQAAVAVAERIP